jgi:hypothetical protein
LVPVPARKALPATFTYQQAREAGWSKRALYQARDAGEIEAIGRGVFRRHDAEAGYPDLLEVAARAPLATLCLTSALVRHGLSDAIPERHDLALPRGTRRPALSAAVQWHLFDAATFELGRELVRLEHGLELGLYSAERSIVDAFRLRGREGHELAHEALRRWLRRRGSSPAALLGLAQALPRSEAPLRRALEVLL